MSDRYYGTTSDEAMQAFLNLSPSDYPIAAGVVLWLVVLLMPLGSVDRRDNVAGFTYMLFNAAAAVTLALALPGRLTRHRDAAVHLVLMTVVAALAGLRWIWRRPKAKETP